MTDLPDLRSPWDLRDPAGAERKFRELLPRAQTEPAYHAELLAQIARTYSLRRQFAEAHALLDTAESLLTADMHRPHVQCLLERGRTYNSAENPKAALPLFESAYRLATEKHLDSLAVDAGHMIAIAHPDPDEQLRWNLRVIQFIESSSDASLKSWLGPLYNNAGWTCHDRGNYGKSLEFLNKARFHHDQHGDAKAKFIARWSVAKLLRLNNCREEAMRIQKALETEMTERNDLDGFVFEELAELSLAHNDPQTARDYFRKAYALLEKVDWLAQGESARLNRIKKLAEV